MALAGLHYLDYNPNDKWSFATSLGHYKHSTAGAIGASFKVGEQDPTLKTRCFEMAKQIKDLQTDNTSLCADNEELRAGVNEIKARLRTL